MKKKIFLAVFSIFMAVAVLAGGTLAWFTAQANTEEIQFKAGTVEIEAERVISFEDDGSGSGGFEWVEGNIFPNRVSGHFRKGAGKLGNLSFQNGRNDPNSVLNDDSSFFSLGLDGYVSVEFDKYIYPVKDPSQPTVFIVETTRGSYPEEKALVYISDTGKEDGNWILIGEASNKQTNQFTLNSQDIPSDYAARYIKVVDNTNFEEAFSGYGNNDRTVDGFDVTAIYVKGAYQSGDFNWNPGDSSTKQYRVVNTGTKSIRLRGKLTGQWYEFDDGTNQWVPWASGSNSVMALSAGSSWTKDGDYFYYNGEIPGTFSGATDDERTVTLDLTVSSQGNEMGNEYQGKRFVISGVFEAIQSSNGAGWADYTIDGYPAD